MRGFFYILALTGVFFLCGLHTADAKGKEELTIPANMTDEQAMITIEKLEGIMSKLEAQGGKDGLNSTLQNAVKKHPQLAELVLILQEYGVFTDIVIPAKQRQEFQKKLAQQK